MKNLNKKYLILLTVLIILVISIFLIIIFLKNRENTKIEESWKNPYSKVDKNDVQYKEDVSVNEIKEETGITGDSDLYVVETEFDGRRILNVKKDIQYKVAFAGIKKGSKPSMEEVEELNKKHPTNNGIWIDQSKQNEFLELLKTITNSSYEIDNEGYLKIKNKNEQNENDKKIESIINGNKKVIVTISNIYYQVDNVTGEIVEYPFEQLDNYQTCDTIRNNNNEIIVITTNSNNKLKNNEIMEDVLQNI